MIPPRPFRPSRPSRPTRPTLLRLLAAATTLLISGCSADSLGEPVASSAVAPLGVVLDAEAAADTTGVYVADSGFRPDIDGFAFENYTTGDGIVDLRPSDLHALFGDAVCAVGTGPDCRLSSPAVTWMDQLNAAMGGGHCEGFAVLSQIFLAELESPRRYGAPITYELDPTTDAELYPAIARWFATQAAEPSNSARRLDLTPVEVVAELRATLGRPRTPENTYTIAIFQPGYEAGHAVTPYAIEDRGDGITWILIYDNNHPGVPRAIEVDTVADTWTYEAAINPEDDSTRYEGDASTSTLAITPISARLAAQDCPFCAGELDEELAARNQLSLTGPGARLAGTDFHVRDSSGRVHGRRGGEFVADIDGAGVLPLLTSLDDAPAPLLDLPASLGVDVTVGAGDEAARDMSFALVGAGYDVLIDGIDLPAGAADTIHLSEDGTRVSYTSHTTSTPTIEVTTGNEDGYSYDLRVRASDLDRAGRVTVASPEDTADVYVGAVHGGRFVLELVRLAPDGTETPATSAHVRVPAGQMLLLPLEEWTSSSPLAATVLDEDGQPARSVTFR